MSPVPPGENMAALTIDFHNTLVECDKWFELEVRSLVSSVLAWTDATYGLPQRSVEPAAADAAYRKLRQSIHQHGHELDAVRSTVTVLHRLGAELPESIVAESVDALMRDVLETANPVPGAKELLESLHRLGIPLAIVSSAVHHPFLEWSLERFGMRAHLQAVITSASAGYYKSRPEIYWAALAAIDRPAGGSTHLGDSLRFDVGGANQAGMRTIWFDRKGTGVNGETDIRPDLVVSSLQTDVSQVIELLTSTS